MSNNGHGLSPEIIEQLKEQMDLARVKTRKAPGGEARWSFRSPCRAAACATRR